MTFYFEGRTTHELMTSDKLFKNRRVDKTENIESTHKVVKNKINPVNEDSSKLIKQSYQKVARFVPDEHVVYAEQIMTFPVTTLFPENIVEQAYKLFHKHKFRHLPVINSDKRLQGIISDRDILKVLGNINEQGKNIKISTVMTTKVLTAIRKTDIRYITRLFVENRIGSMPVMDERKLVGMITRTDILKAVINHYELELWV